MIKNAPYNHILVALDLEADNHTLLARACNLARSLDAQLSVIHVDVDLHELYSELIDIDIVSAQSDALNQTRQKLDAALEIVDYPWSKRLLVCGDMVEQVVDAVREYQIDLLMCGHHQNFWRQMFSASRQLLNEATCDVLVIPLQA